MSTHSELAMSLEGDGSTLIYARFGRRLQGLCIDFIIVLMIVTGALVIAIALKSDDIGRVLGFTVAAVLLLYEPLLVSLTGSTLGHLYCNLRVVDDRHGGNVSFLKAVARVAIKTTLGWYSFLTMLTTSRYQAAHDLLTRSTVQIRDRAKARPHHFASRRIAPAGMPSPIRRIGVIVVYLVLWLAVVLIAYAPLIGAGYMSQACIDFNRCSTAERWTEAVASLALIVGSVLVVVLGWRGRLWGARVNRSSSWDQA